LKLIFQSFDAQRQHSAARLCRVGERAGQEGSAAPRGEQFAVLDDDAAAAIPDHADDPEMAIQRRQQSAILAHCLTRLSAAHREVIDLVYYHDRSIDEVAAITGVTASTVKTRMFYARNRIAQVLDGFGMRRASRPAEASPRKRHTSAAHKRAMASFH